MVEETGHGSVAWFRAANTVEFACWLYPGADADVACFVSDYCSWLFSVDDHHPHESNPDMHQVMDLVGECLGVLAGASPQEVVAMNSLSVNLHLLLTSFYRPTAQRHKLLIEANAFPSDRYAAISHLRSHGYEPAQTLIEIAPRDGEDSLRTELTGLGRPMVELPFLPTGVDRAGLQALAAALQADLTTPAQS